MAEIKQITLTQLEKEPNLDALVEEYAAECAIHGLPHPAAKVDMYKTMELTGWLNAFGAYHEDKLIGFAFVIATVVPHYSALIASAESLFVAKAFRNTGAGTRLVRACEANAKAKGSPGILLTAPFGGPLAAMLDVSSAYTEVNRVFYRRDL